MVFNQETMLSNSSWYSLQKSPNDRLALSILADFFRRPRGTMRLGSDFFPYDYSYDVMLSAKSGSKMPRPLAVACWRGADIFITNEGCLWVV